MNAATQPSELPISFQNGREMSGTIFFSWQSDRPSSVCRNFIERALQSAVDRLKADINVEEAVRENLAVDKDTRNVPGTPPIFETIMAKIAAASVFVPDLTFVMSTANQSSVSNPNVLIEYGLALRKPGHAQIIAVMNDAFGKPTEEDMPFNLRHSKFPITYTLREGASDEERRDTRKSLANRLESALRVVFDILPSKLQRPHTCTLHLRWRPFIRRIWIISEQSRSSLRGGSGEDTK